MSYIRRNDYWSFFLENSDRKDLLTYVNDYEKRKTVFNKYVNTINLELSTYCNRRCGYCPVSIYPRKQEYMDKNIFYKILNELEEIGYAGGLSLNLYNEPLYDDDLEMKINKIKQKLSQTYVYFNSNGDRLSKERIDSLWQAGLDRIQITLQTPPNERWIDTKKRNEFKTFLQRIGMEDVYNKRKEVLGHSIYVQIPYPNNRLIIVKCNNWDIDGNDRGGILKQLSRGGRTNPCLNPLREVCIAYNGEVKPCCNIYYNVSGYGNIKNDTILDCYFSRILIELRRSHVLFGEKKGACATCNTDDNAPDDLKRIELPDMNV